MFKSSFFICFYSLVLTISLVNSAHAQDRPDPTKIPIKTIAVTDKISMLMGFGGNVGVFEGDDQIIMIDGQFPPVAENLSAAVSKLSSKPIDLIINSHWHLDHTGTNAFFGQQGVPILGHRNVYKRLSSENISVVDGKKIPPSPTTALPTMTYNDQMTLRYGDEQVVVSHIKNANTDSDSLIHFRTSNVIFSGDAYFQGAYPLIDTITGGTIDGLINAAQVILSLSDDNTKIIPGHGQLSSIDNVKKDMQMLIAVRTNVQKLIDEGKTLDAIKVAKPSEKFDAEYGQGFIKADRFITAVFTDLSK